MWWRGVKERDEGERRKRKWRGWQEGRVCFWNTCEKTRDLEGGMENMGRYFLPHPSPFSPLIFFSFFLSVSFSPSFIIWSSKRWKNVSFFLLILIRGFYSIEKWEGKERKGKNFHMENVLSQEKNCHFKHHHSLTRSFSSHYFFRSFFLIQRGRERERKK